MRWRGRRERKGDVKGGVREREMLGRERERGDGKGVEREIGLSRSRGYEGESIINPMVISKQFWGI